MILSSSSHLALKNFLSYYLFFNFLHFFQDNYTPLILASKNGHVETVKRLCEKGKANVDIKAGWVSDGIEILSKKFL